MRARQRLPFRTCNSCNKPRFVEDFYVHGGYVDRRCKTCYKKWTDDWTKKNHEKKKEQRRLSARRTYPDRAHKVRDQNLLTKYGITSKTYTTLLEEQGSVCAVCKKPETAMQNSKTKRLAVDLLAL